MNWKDGVDDAKWVDVQGYNPVLHRFPHKARYLEALSTQMREVLAINAAFRNGFGMAIKAAYHGTLHQEAKILRHYLQSCNEHLRIFTEHQQEGIHFIQRSNFLKENRAWRVMLSGSLGYPANDARSDRDKVRLINVLAAHAVCTRVIDVLLREIHGNTVKMLTAPYMLPEHPASQLVGAGIMNSERIVLHLAFIACDINYFRKVYKQLYRCDCFF
eukprot:Seg4607.5 transcript_id=Seg4607.5/GoldUCD/mRNA.D3Y31 product="hypothetical protein" protein_id=Seg4607.5/GoldUCD/D3Y31